MPIALESASSLESLKFFSRNELEGFSTMSDRLDKFVKAHCPVLPVRPLKFRIPMDAVPRLTDLTRQPPGVAPTNLSRLVDLRRPQSLLRGCKVTMVEIRGNLSATPNEIRERIYRLLQLKWSWSGATAHLRDLPPASIASAGQFMGLFDNCGFFMACFPRGPVPTLSDYLGVFGTSSLDRFGVVTIGDLDDLQDDEEDKADYLVEALLSPTKSPRVGRHVVIRKGSYTAAMLIKKFVARAQTDTRRLRAVHSVVVQGRLDRWEGLTTPYARDLVRNRATHVYENRRTSALIDGRSTEDEVFLQVTPAPMDSSRPTNPTDRPYYRF
ncbi:hypothetical protein AAVH_23488 [Aphelenchoides avenae]|nr:hypothetical protein AAVH_23488 [Aphelenchus avenae]